MVPHPSISEFKKLASFKNDFLITAYLVDSVNDGTAYRGPYVGVAILYRNNNYTAK